jgi:transcriptional regulator with XRE-family HTH domain
MLRSLENQGSMGYKEAMREKVRMQAGSACSVSDVPTPPPDGTHRDRDREWAELQQQILREETKDAQRFRALFEMQERVIAQKVRQLRAERGWSQEDLAERMTRHGWPMHQTTIAKLEAGKRPLRAGEAYALALVFGLPVQALWYVPVAGEPWTLADMRQHLQEADDLVAELERALHSMIVSYADAVDRRMRLAEAMNEAAKRADRGELEELGLDEENLRALIEGLSDVPGRARAGRRRGRAAPHPPALD